MSFKITMTSRPLRPLDLYLWKQGRLSYVSETSKRRTRCLHNLFLCLMDKDFGLPLLSSLPAISNELVAHQFSQRRRRRELWSVLKGHVTSKSITITSVYNQDDVTPDVTFAFSTVTNHGRHEPH